MGLFCGIVCASQFVVENFLNAILSQLVSEFVYSFLLCVISVILSTESLQTLIGSKVSEYDSQLWQPVWVARYSVLIKCRGVIKSKGYVMQATRNMLSLIGWWSSFLWHWWHRIGGLDEIVPHLNVVYSWGGFLNLSYLLENVQISVLS